MNRRTKGSVPKGSSERKATIQMNKDERVVEEETRVAQTEGVLDNMRDVSNETRRGVEDQACREGQGWKAWKRIRRWAIIKETKVGRVVITADRVDVTLLIIQGRSNGRGHGLQRQRRGRVESRTNLIWSTERLPHVVRAKPEVPCKAS